MLGMGMVFVLLTYGGWNETAYLSGELRNPARNMGRVLLLGTLLVTTLYLLTNLALLQIFGLQALSQSDAIGADLMEIVAGSWAAQGLSLLICFTALSTLNATILTGARVYYALGGTCRDCIGSRRGTSVARRPCGHCWYRRRSPCC